MRAGVVGVHRWVGVTIRGCGLEVAGLPRGWLAPSQTVADARRVFLPAK